MENNGSIKTISEGMIAFGDSTAINSGEILSPSGIILINSAKGINDTNGYISLKEDEGTGIKVRGKRTSGVNKGIINITSNDSYGFDVSEGGYGLNDETGKIYLNSTNGIGMHAEGADSIIENKGEIILSGKENKGNNANNSIGLDSNHNIGLKAENGAKIINSGKITYIN